MCHRESQQALLVSQVHAIPSGLNVFHAGEFSLETSYFESLTQKWMAASTTPAMQVNP